MTAELDPRALQSLHKYVQETDCADHFMKSFELLYADSWQKILRFYILPVVAGSVSKLLCPCEPGGLSEVPLAEPTLWQCRV